MGRRGSILRTLQRDPDVWTLLQLKADVHVIKNEPTERGQRTRGGMITSTMFYTVQQNEREPRRESLRNTTGNSEMRKSR
eukprot:8356255-Alexandrium_andersonii.AAC.1